MLFGEGIELEQWEIEKWDRFLVWISEKGYQPISDVFKTKERLGFQLMYFYCIDKPDGSDDEVFDATYKNLKQIEESEFPTDAQKFKKFIDTGAIRIVGRATELGHQPILDINVNKVIKEVVGKHKASQQELEQYFTFWFTWVKN